MIIQCPACGQQAKLPESKEGAKVRCSDCERVYVAKPVGAARSSSRGTDPTKIFLYGGGVVLFAIVMLFVNKSDTPDRVVTPEPEPEREVYVDSNGWEGELVKFARGAHEMAADPKTEAGLLGVLDAEMIWARHNTPPAEGEPEREVDTRIWSLVTKSEISVFMANELEEILRGEGDRLVAAWKPTDGWVVDSSDDDAIIRLKLMSRLDPKLPERHIEWRVVKRKGKWRAWYYERWYSPEELAGQKRARTKKVERKTLSDGSQVIEGVLRPIPYMDDTPPELQARVEQLIDQMIDFENSRPRDVTQAREELLEIGKPAIPGLLTRLVDIPFEGEENAMKLNLIHMQLMDMTGYITTFKVSTVLGGTKERSESGLKQWFGWYDRKWKRFEGPPEPEDPFFGMEPLTDKERREIERDMANERLNSGGDN